jgi:hypothetical protein
MNRLKQYKSFVRNIYGAGDNYPEKVHRMSIKLLDTTS